MRDEPIIGGDDVRLERTKTAHQGQIVSALVHGSETRLKRFFSACNLVRPQPANVEMEPAYVPAAPVPIQRPGAWRPARIRRIPGVSGRLKLHGRMAL
jgi:repressor LexA